MVGIYYDPLKYFIDINHLYIYHKITETLHIQILFLALEICFSNKEPVSNIIEHKSSPPPWQQVSEHVFSEVKRYFIALYAFSTVADFHLNRG